MKTLKTRGLHPVAHLTIAYMSHAALLLELWAGVTFQMITMMMRVMVMVMVMTMNWRHTLNIGISWIIVTWTFSMHGITGGGRRVGTDPMGRGS